MAAHHDGGLSQVAHAKHVAQLRVGLVKIDYSDILAWGQLVVSGSLVMAKEDVFTAACAHVAVVSVLLEVGEVQRAASVGALQHESRVRK